MLIECSFSLSLLLFSLFPSISRLSTPRKSSNSRLDSLLPVIGPLSPLIRTLSDAMTHKERNKEDDEIRRALFNLEKEKWKEVQEVYVVMKEFVILREIGVKDSFSRGLYISRHTRLSWFFQNVNRPIFITDPKVN